MREARWWRASWDALVFGVIIAIPGVVGAVSEVYHCRIEWSGVGSSGVGGSAWLSPLALFGCAGVSVLAFFMMALLWDDLEHQPPPLCAFLTVPFLLFILGVYAVLIGLAWLVPASSSPGDRLPSYVMGTLIVSFLVVSWLKGEFRATARRKDGRSSMQRSSP